mgnify:CR=1 FL=1
MLCIWRIFSGFWKVNILSYKKNREIILNLVLNKVAYFGIPLGLFFLFSIFYF